MCSKLNQNVVIVKTMNFCTHKQYVNEGCNQGFSLVIDSTRLEFVLILTLKSYFICMMNRLNYSCTRVTVPVEVTLNVFLFLFIYLYIIVLSHLLRGKVH